VFEISWILRSGFHSSLLGKKFSLVGVPVLFPVGRVL
jgi:hypothetical protein